MKSKAPQGVQDRELLVSQNAGDNQAAICAEGPPEDWQRGDQQFAKEIGRDNVVARGWLPSQQIRGNEAGP